MKIDISNWDKYTEVEELLEKYNKDTISDLLRMKVEVTNYNEEDYFKSITKKLVSLNRITESEKTLLCKYVLYKFYEIFFERKTTIKHDSQITMTRFRELQENELFEDLIDIYLDFFKIGAAAGNTTSQELFNIFKNILHVDNLPSENENVEYKIKCKECDGYGYINLDVCHFCKGEGTLSFTDCDLTEYYKKIYRHEVSILSFDKENIKQCFSDIIKNMFGEPIVPISNYYKPKCKLIGEDGNIFNLLRLVMNCLINEGLKEEAKAVNDEVLAAGSYDEALRIFMKYVDVY